MRKSVFSILIILLMFSLSCGTKESTNLEEPATTNEPISTEEATLTIKAGIVLQSGDVKDVARQEFLITKSDVMGLFKDSLDEHIMSSELTKKEAKDAIGYESKLNSLQNEISKYKGILAQKSTASRVVLDKVCDDLRANLNKSAQQSLSETDTFFKEQANEVRKGETTLDELNAIIEKCDDRYESKLKIWPTGNTHKTWLSLQNEFKEAIKPISEIENQSKIEQNNIYKTNQKIKELDKELETKITEKVIQQRANAIESFQKKVLEAYVSAFKTNLSGEATLSLPKGKYFFFGLATIGINEIIWSLPITLEESEKYFELSNDNAYSISDEGLFQELLKAFAGFDISQ